MDRNKVEIHLLQNNPDKLLLKYQQTIRIIVRLQVKRGLIRRADQEDLIQEINRKLIERLPRIQKQYNGSCQLRTYLSVIIRNMCLEELRKNEAVYEPEPAPYQSQLLEEDIDPFLIDQEYERFERVLMTFGKESARLGLIMKYMSGVGVTANELLDFPVKIRHQTKHELCQVLNTAIDDQRKIKFTKLTIAITRLERKHIPPDSLRKWYSARLTICLRLMNGNPPRCAYTAESLELLIERHYSKKSRDIFPLK